jgi:hypothetical protein
MPGETIAFVSVLLNLNLLRETIASVLMLLNLIM